MLFQIPTDNHSLNGIPEKYACYTHTFPTVGLFNSSHSSRVLPFTSQCRGSTQHSATMKCSRKFIKIQ